MLKGIFPVIPTLFTDDNHIDPDSLHRVVEFAIKSGAHGLVFPGVASEYSYLSTEERDRLMGAVHTAVGGRVDVIAGASGPTSDAVITAARQAKQYGINHLMIMAPSGLGTNLDDHQRFFDDITSAVSGIEILLQNAPAPIGAGLAPDAIASLIKANAAVTYAKEETLPSGPAITEILRAGIPHLVGVMGGGGARYIIDELRRGAIGAIPAVELTDLHVAIFNAFESGKTEQARLLYQMSLPLLASQAIYRMRLTKYVLRQRGVVDRMHVRAPLPPLDDFARRDIDQMLADLESDFGLRDASKSP